MEDGAEEPASQETAQDGHNDVDEQVRAVVHDFSGDPADHCGYYQVNENVHCILLKELSKLRAFFDSALV
jgi:hypothetical protein